MAAVDFQQTIARWENLILTGKGYVVRSEVRKLNSKKIPFHFRFKIAQILRRIDDVNMGLRMIAPLVLNAHGELNKNANHRQIAEYALLLDKAGLVELALTHLQLVSAAEVPQVALYKSFCYFHLWDYPAAAATLRQYVKDRPESYELLVGQVNLLSALIGIDDIAEADELSQQLIAKCERENRGRLLGNCLEMRAQIDIARGRYADADDNLNRSLSFLKGDSQRYGLYIAKWKAYLAALATKDITPLAKLRIRAQKAGDGQTLRDIDRLQLKIRFDEALFNKLAYGSKYVKYQEMIFRQLTKDVEQLPPFATIGGDSGPLLDVFAGTMDGREIVNIGKKIHHLIFTLLSDLYEPFPAVLLFAKIYPDEVFNVDSSTNRTHQLVKRANDSFLAQNLPLRISHQRQGYRLNPLTQNLRLLVPLKKSPPRQEHLDFHKLRPILSTRPLSGKVISSQLGYSKSKTRTLLEYWLKHKLIETVGSGSQVSYKLASEPILKAAA